MRANQLESERRSGEERVRCHAGSGGGYAGARLTHEHHQHEPKVKAARLVYKHHQRISASPRTPPPRRQRRKSIYFCLHQPLCKLSFGVL